MDEKVFFEAEPETFKLVRAACGINQVRYEATLGLQKGRQSPTLSLVGTADAAGRSQAFFLLSPDQQLIAKSCTGVEWEMLLRILPAYLSHMQGGRQAQSLAGNAAGCCGFTHSLLPRYLGMYEITPEKDDAPTRMLVMINVFSGSQKIDRRYDLKGSTRGRRASKKERLKATAVFKDLDWIAQEAKVSLQLPCKVQLFDTLREDVRFLTEHNLMDYSLLVGVHTLGSDVLKREAMEVAYFEDATRRCYLGIVDILTDYGCIKRAETLWKSRLQCGGQAVSCQHPRVYGARFLRFLEDHVFASDLVRRKGGPYGIRSPSISVENSDDDDDASETKV